MLVKQILNSRGRSKGLSGLFLLRFSTNFKAEYQPFISLAEKSNLPALSWVQISRNSRIRGWTVRQRPDLIGRKNCAKEQSQGSRVTRRLYLFWLILIMLKKASKRVLKIYWINSVVYTLKLLSYIWKKGVREKCIF